MNTIHAPRPVIDNIPLTLGGFDTYTYQKLAHAVTKLRAASDLGIKPTCGIGFLEPSLAANERYCRFSIAKSSYKLVKEPHEQVLPIPACGSPIYSVLTRAFCVLLGANSRVPCQFWTIPGTSDVSHPFPRACSALLLRR